MNEKEFAEIQSDALLQRQLYAAARRYFAWKEDQEDALAEAWVRILVQPAGWESNRYLKAGLKAIRAFYMRLWRRRRKEISVDEESAGHPSHRASSTLKALAQMAISGDW